MKNKHVLKTYTDIGQKNYNKFSTEYFLSSKRFVCNNSRFK